MFHCVLVGMSLIVGGMCNAMEQSERVEQPTLVESIDVAEVWAGHPVGFALLTRGGMQYVGYYDDERRLTVASRGLDSAEWTTHVLPKRTGWDSHNYITMVADDAGQLHLAADMHGSRLVYFRTTAAGDITTFERVEHMVGDLESRCTYPKFLRGLGNALLFTYRDGGSGNGNQIYNRYDVETQTWERLLDKPLLDGGGKMNAYATTPRRGPDGKYHMVWVWRDTPDASTNHDVSYARSENLLNWETSTGEPIALPITIGTGDVVDPVPAGGGAINGNVKLGFDAAHRPVVSYHKFDADGNTQVYNARQEDSKWMIYQMSDWDYRWDFGGGGSLVFEIGLSAIHQLPDGRWGQTYSHSQYGGGGWVIDPDTMKVIGDYQAPPSRPAEVQIVRSAFPGMQVRWAGDSGGDNDPGTHYLLRWETLSQNRDKPREGTLPEPVMLEVVKVKRAGAE